jgi:hypothetical protein
MIILWIQSKKKNKQDQTSKNEKESFKAHDDVMKKFRMAHEELDVLSNKDILTGDGNLLAPVSHVKLSNHVQN